MTSWAKFHKMCSRAGKWTSRSANICGLGAIVLFLPAWASANLPPVVDSFTASSTTVAPGETIDLSITASDEDCADVCTDGCGLVVRADLTTWSATGGTFLSEDPGTSRSPYMTTAQWQAPITEAVYTIEVSLSDSGTWMCGDRQTTTADLQVLVTSTANQAPIVDVVTADPPRMFPEDTTLLRCFATDPDGDLLTYSWTSDFGTLTPGAGATAELTATGPGAATVRCTATDPSGAPGTGSVIVSVSDVTADRFFSDGLATPQRVAVDSTGNLYVVDRSAGGIAVIRLQDGRFMYRLATADVTTVAVDWADRLLVGTESGAAVLGRDGRLICQLLSGSAGISDVAVDLERQHYAILERHSGRVAVFDEIGSLVAEFGATGDGPADLRSPSGIAVLPDGRIVVADSGHGTLKIFNRDGTLSSAIGSSGSGAGQFVELDDVAVDSRGVIWASDSFQDWVQSFGADGSLREIVGTYGVEMGQFKTAAGIAVAENFDSLVVASANSSSIQVFQLGSQTPIVWPAGEASLSDTSLLFPAQAVGTTSTPIGIDLLNIGNGPLGFSAIEVTGPFAVSHGCTVVDPAEGCTFDISFRPSTPGYQTGDLLLFTSADDQPLRIVLSGDAFVPAQLVVDPPQLTFAHQGIGTTSPVQTVLLSNPGTATLNLGSITEDGPFTVNSHCGRELSGGASCTLWVDFTPTTAGTVAGSLRIHSDAPTSPRAVRLVGTGEILELSPLPGSLTFGAVARNTSSLTESIQVVNTGTGNVAVDTIALDGPNAADFEITTDQCSGNRVDEGQSCWLQVSFSPSELGIRTAQVTIAIVEGLQFTVDLNGGSAVLFVDGFESGDTLSWSTVIPSTSKSLRVMPVDIQFGEVTFGARSLQRIVTVTNGGDHAVWLGQLRILGSDAMEFDLTDDTCGSTWLEGGSSCRFTVHLLTLADGEFTALVEIPTPVIDADSADPVRLEGTVWLP